MVVKLVPLVDRCTSNADSSVALSTHARSMAVVDRAVAVSPYGAASTDAAGVVAEASVE